MTLLGCPQQIIILSVYTVQETYSKLLHRIFFVQNMLPAHYVCCMYSIAFQTNLTTEIHHQSVPKSNLGIVCNIGRRQNRPLLS